MSNLTGESNVEACLRSTRKLLVENVKVDRAQVERREDAVQPIDTAGDVDGEANLIHVLQGRMSHVS